MNMNFLEIVKTKKQVMKLSAVAFVGAMSMFGFSHGVSAMISSENVTAEQKQETKLATDADASTETVDAIPAASADRGKSEMQTENLENVGEKIKSESTSGLEEASTVADEKKDETVIDSQDDVKRFELCKIAAEENNAQAQYALGLCYQYGKGVAKAENKAVELYRLAADQGFVEAQYVLGWCYLHGKGVKKDEKKAVELYQLAADQGFAEAQNNLGWCYQLGKIAKKNEKKAVELYQLAADQGFAGAQNNLGWCYQNGIGVEKDEKKAVELYSKSADQGFAEAQNNLGGCYQNGVGVERSAKKAVELYRLAADQGFVGAQYNLGICYQNGAGVERSAKKAVELYQLAAAQGLAEAQNKLGMCYERGSGVEKDERKAVELYRLAADQGLAAAQNALGLCYAEGIGIPKDKKKAVEFIQKAVAQGYAEAQNSLGWCYQHGKGVKKDEKKAVAWYRKSAEQGYAEAQNNLGMCYQEGIGVGKDEKKAAELYLMAAMQGIAVAWYHLGICYEHGFGVEQDYDQMILLYKKAIAKGDINAKNKLEYYYDVVKESDVFYKDIQKIKRLKEDMNLLCSSCVDVKDKQEKLCEIIEEIKQLSGLKLNIRINHNELFSEYMYYKQALEFLDAKMKSKGADNKNAEKFYKYMVPKIEAFKLKKEKMLDAFKAMKLYFSDIECLIPDLNDASVLYGYFNLFGNVQSFIENINDNIKNFDDMKFDDSCKFDQSKCQIVGKDMSSVYQPKEDWEKEIKKMQCIGLLNAYYDSMPQDLVNTPNPKIIKQLSSNAQEECFWICKFVKPVLEDIPNSKKKTSKDLSSRVNKMKSWVGLFSEGFDRGPICLKNIESMYNFSSRMERSKGFDLYDRFLSYWDKREKALASKPMLKLNMMMSNLYLYKEYVEHLSSENSELEEKCNKAKDNIGISLMLLSRGKDKGEDFLISWSMFNTTATRNVIQDLFCAYRAKIKEQMANFSEEIDDTKEDVVSEESPSEKMSDEESTDAAARVEPEENLPELPKREIRREQQASEALDSKAETEEDQQASFDRLKDSIERYKMVFEELSNEHAGYVGRTYVRIRNGKVEEFAHKTKINKMVSAIKDAFDKAKHYGIDNITKLREIADALPFKLASLEELLSTARTFMSRENTAEKGESLSSPKAAAKKGKRSGSPTGDGKDVPRSEATQRSASPQEDLDVDSIIVDYISAKVQKKYKTYIDEEIEKKYKQKLISWLRSESSTDIEIIKSAKVPFISCRYRDSGRVCFRLDKDFKTNRTIHIIGVLENHEYGTLVRQVNNQYKPKQ